MIPLRPRFVLRVNVVPPRGSALDPETSIFVFEHPHGHPGWLNGSVGIHRVPLGAGTSAHPMHLSRDGRGAANPEFEIGRPQVHPATGCDVRAASIRSDDHG